MTRFARQGATISWEGDTVQRANLFRGVSVALFVVAAVFVAACGDLPVGERGVKVAPATSSDGGLRAPQGTARLTQADVCADASDPACTPTGAHAKHTGTCGVCHAVAGRLAFQIGGPAYGSGWTSAQPRPGFDATTKTCSNVACHGVPAGTFSYYFPGNETDADGYPIPELKTVNYGGTMAAITPPWYATGAGCSACHGNPPANGSDGSNAWHSGSHANNANFAVGGGLVLNANQCELCHNNLVGNVFSPIAASANAGTGYQGTLILLPTFHGNGLNVAARFRSACFGCH